MGIVSPIKYYRLNTIISYNKATSDSINVLEAMKRAPDIIYSTPMKMLITVKYNQWRNYINIYGTLLIILIITILCLKTTIVDDNGVFVWFIRAFILVFTLGEVVQLIGCNKIAFSNLKRILILFFMEGA